MLSHFLNHFLNIAGRGESGGNPSRLLVQGGVTPRTGYQSITGQSIHILIYTYGQFRVVGWSNLYVFGQAAMADPGIKPGPLLLWANSANCYATKPA